MPNDLIAGLRPEAREAPHSGIVEVFNYGRTRQGLIPLWVGEGDLPTPAFISDAATRSLQNGETFYTYQRGLPDLRAAIARYHQRAYGRPFDPERFFVTGGGMQAIQIATRMTAGSGDEVLVPTPAWPNFGGAIGISGARTVEVPMTFGNAGWTLNLDRLFAAATARTKAIVINSPSNPTGWTATLDELKAVLAFAQKRGLWIIADEVYHPLLLRRRPRAFVLRHRRSRRAHPLRQYLLQELGDDRLAHRLLSAPPALGDTIEDLVQYSTSGTAAFMQRAATVALDDGDGFVDLQVQRAHAGRDIVVKGLAATGRVRFAEPDGAFYLFFSVDGEPDTRKLALRLVDETLVGLAPGSAFGDAGANFMRLCFARDAGHIREATERLAAWLTKR